MQKIEKEEDLLIVPTSYLEGLERMLGQIVEQVDVHSLDAMEQIITLREWMNTSHANKEARKLYPEIQWDNVHLLLPLREKDNEHIQQ